jgi:hypothetical protein
MKWTWLLLTLAACDVPADGPRSRRSGLETGSGEPTQVEVQVQSCSEEGEGCMLSESSPPCCPGLHCDFVGYAMTGCAPLRAEGAWCEHSGQCADGTCVEGHCSSACVPSGVLFECSSESRCCEGVCHDGGYGWGECRPPSADGEFCWYDEVCASGHCVEYRCASVDL